MGALKNKTFWIGVIVTMVVVGVFPQANLFGMLMGQLGGGKGKSQ